MASRTSSALATLALAALSTAAVLTLGRVFASGRFVLPAIGAVLLAHLLGFVARTRALRPPTARTSSRCGSTRSATTCGACTGALRPASGTS